MASLPWALAESVDHCKVKPCGHGDPDSTAVEDDIETLTAEALAVL